MSARSLLFLLVGIASCGVEGARSTSPTPARHPPTAENAGSSVLVWVTAKDGDRSTYRLRADGRPLERMAGVRIATRAGEWTWIASPAPVITEACADGGVGGVQKPAGVGTTTRVALVGDGGAQTVVVRDTPCCPNEARHTADLRASLGPLLFVTESVFSFHCGAHGHTEASFFVWDAERRARVDVLTDVPDAARLKVAASTGIAEAVPGDAAVDLTALFPVVRAGRLGFEAQLTFPACYACSDGAWSSYTRSVRLPALPPPVLEPFATVPRAVVLFAKSHPEVELGGWSR
jgi:hypothetical protein